MSGPELDAEKLAALLDGRLGDAERRELLARIAESPEHVELLADVAAASGGETTSMDAARSRRRRWRLRPNTWMAIAAGIVGITAVTLVARSRPAVSAGAHLERVQFDLWSSVRGAEPVEPSSDSARAWRVGVRLADLDAAIRARDTVLTGRFANEISTLLLPSDPAAALFRAIADNSPRASSSALRAARDAIDPRIAVSIRNRAETTEAARIAAAASDSITYQRLTRSVSEAGR